MFTALLLVAIGAALAIWAAKQEAHRNKELHSKLKEAEALFLETAHALQECQYENHELREGKL